MPAPRRCSPSACAARSVDDDVEPAQFLHSRADEAFGEAGLGDIAIAGDRLAAERLDLVDDGFARRLVEIVDDDLGPVARELQRDRATVTRSRMRPPAEVVSLRPPDPSAVLQAERGKIMSEIEGADRKLARLAETESASPSFLMREITGERIRECFPSYERIAEAAGCARSTVAR